MPGDRGQVLAALYDNFDTITSLRRRHFRELFFPDSSLTIAALKKLAARCIAADGFYHRVRQIAYWAEDKGMLEKLSPSRKTIRKNKLVDRVQNEPAAENIFADRDDPLNSIFAEAVTQGGFGDCSFRAALTGLAQTRPQTIVDAIRPAAPESNAIEVQFPGHRSGLFQIKKPTREEISLFSEEGKWAVG